jgi:hypothetical protein
MRTIAIVIRFMGYAASTLLILMFLYYELVMIWGNFLHILNPFLHLMVLWSMVTSVEFWILAGIAVGCSYLSDRLYGVEHGPSSTRR